MTMMWLASKVVKEETKVRGARQEFRRSVTRDFYLVQQKCLVPSDVTESVSAASSFDNSLPTARAGNRGSSDYVALASNEQPADESVSFAVEDLVPLDPNAPDVDMMAHRGHINMQQELLPELLGKVGPLSAPCGRNCPACTGVVGSKHTDEAYEEAVERNYGELASLLDTDDKAAADPMPASPSSAVSESGVQLRSEDSDFRL